MRYVLAYSVTNALVRDVSGEDPLIEVRACAVCGTCGIRDVVRGDDPLNEVYPLV
jgi:hypothetical protein